MILWFYDFLFYLDVVAKKNHKESSSAVEGTKPSQTTESEFISDKFVATSDRDLDEVQENMTKLGLTATKEKEEKKTSSTGEKVKRAT